MDKIINIFDYKKEKEKKDHVSDLNGELVELDTVKKMKEKDSLIKEVLKKINYMVCDLGVLYEALGGVLDEKIISSIEYLMTKFQELYDIFNDKIDMDIDIDKLIFKLKLILEQSDYFLSTFERVFRDNEIEYYKLDYFIELVNLYVQYVKDTISNDKYDYNDFDNTLNHEKILIITTVSQIRDNNKAKECTEMLCQLVEDTFANQLSTIQWYAIKEIINNTLLEFLEYDVKTITKCFWDILNLYISNGIFEEMTKEDVSMRIKSLNGNVKMYKKYYQIEDIVNQLAAVLGAYVHDNVFNNVIVSKLEKLLLVLRDVNQYEKQKDKMDNIFFIIKNVCEKLMSLVQLENNNILNEEYGVYIKDGLCNVVNDRIILNTISIICDDLLQYADFKNTDPNYLESDNFDYIWLMAGSNSLNRELNHLVTKDMFTGKDIDVYNSQEYRKILVDIIGKLSCDDYLMDFDNVSAQNIEEDFTLVLNMLKKAFKIDKAMNVYGMSEIAMDIRKLNYTDDIYVTQIFLNAIDSIFSKLKYDFNLREFLKNAKFNPMQVKHGTHNCVSLYENVDNSLMFDGEDYYVVNNKDIEKSGMATYIDCIYCNKEIIYSMVLDSILSKYNKIWQEVYGCKPPKKVK